MLRDESGNTLSIVAAALLPLLAIVGGGIDMARSYLAETRLQQACDAGVLAARQKLGADASPSAGITADAQKAGDSYFKLNFSDRAYGTTNRVFTMSMDPETAVDGVATVTVPTAIMKIFGNRQVDIKVECTAQTSMSNADVMMVLDVTGSMGTTNSGDAASRIETMREVVKNFHAQMEASRNPASRIRYGFVPYATNVNVGGLLKSDWLVDRWTYQTRQARISGTTTGSGFAQTVLSQTGTREPIAEYRSASCPANTVVTDWGAKYDEVAGPPAQYKQSFTRNGQQYNCIQTESGYLVKGEKFTDFETTSQFTESSTTVDQIVYDYMPRTFDVDAVKDSDGNALARVWATIDVDTNHPDKLSRYWWNGCIEERATYEIEDYNNVDFTKALDLNIDLVPSSGSPATQWRPKFNGLGYARGMRWDGTGAWSVPNILDTREQFVVPQWVGDLSSCPEPAQKLQVMDAAQIAAYVDALQPRGKTYHDIGMIWGGRLVSPTGLFAAENADINGVATTRHLIFLTDGQTEPYDLADGAYGIEPLDARRWSLKSAQTMTDMVEKRFAVACDEVKKRNVTVWVIAFGTDLNPVMSDCAGPGHSFEAANASELGAAFADIAGSIGELRMTK